MSLVLSELARWTGSRVAVEVEWRPSGERLAHMAGVLGEVDVREEPDRWGDIRAYASVPIGEFGSRLAFDSLRIEEAEHHQAAMTLLLGDEIRVELNRVSAGDESG
jgi:hypothetical protein